MMQAPAPNTRPLRAPLRGTGMTRPNAAVALESAAKARAAMQTAQQRGSAAGGQPMAPAAQQGPQRAPQAAPQRQQAAQAQPGRGAPAPASPVAYSNPEWNPRAQAAKQLQGLATVPQIGPVALPAGMQPAGKPGGNIMASMAPGSKNAAVGAFYDKHLAQLGAEGRGVAGATTGVPLPTPGYYSSDEEAFDPLSGEFIPPGEQVSDPLNDPSMWTDETDEFEAEYGTQAEQQAAQNAALAEQQAFIEQTGMTPDEFAGVVGMDLPGFEDMVPEGIWDTLALAGQDEDEWTNENNPGPGWAWNDATGKWMQEELPPGVDKNDPRWTYNEESGKWQLFEATEDDKLVDRDYWDEKAKGALESDVEDYMNPELENQKKAAWDQAQAANLDVAKALGSRGIGASGLVGMGMGDVFKATQNNVQGLEFDEYTRAAELRLNEIRTILSGRQGDLSAEMQKELADEAAKLEKELAQMQYAREDRDDIWQQIDNQAAALEKQAKNGWNPSSLSAFKKWASTPGNDPYKAVITVGPNEEVVFNEAESNAAMGQLEKANPADVGFDPASLAGVADEAEWYQSYQQYASMAKSAGMGPMTYEEFRDWVSSVVGGQPSGSTPGGVKPPEPPDEYDYGDGI